MELTQRLECTQELYSNNCEKTYPEQIGFLGICGTKYPLKKGPNKIGRDPETCNIVLNLNSVSRQHAVINILNSQDYMLMDLDSANKTKLSDKTLLPYIPHPLRNGDMIQFGEIFGVFRLLQEPNDLPMTQAMDILDTPVQNRHVSKLNVHATTIPESPEVSDKDDSFIAASQQKPKNVFKSPNNNFLKSSGKTISIKSIGTNKIDNVYWSSSKKSESFSMQSNISGNLDDSVISLRNSRTNVSEQSIHEIDTQIPYEHDNVDKNIHELDTQVPNVNQNESIDSIYNANTQIVESSDSPNIHEMETQLSALDNLPEVCKIEEQENIHINFSTDNKENDNNIYNAETQILFDAKSVLLNDNIHNEETQIVSSVKTVSSCLDEKVNIKHKLSSSSNVSDDIILFDEIDNEPLQDEFESQQLLSPKLKVVDQAESDENNADSQDIHFVPKARGNRIESDSSTDCEDINIAATQIISKIKNNDDSTDCADEPNIILKANLRKSPDIDEDVTDCEDNLIDDDIIQPNKVVENIEDLPTQILDDATIDEEITKIANKDDSFENLPTQLIIEDNKSTISTSKQKSDNTSDLPTQGLVTEPQKGTCFEEALTQQIYSEEVIKFKVPFQSPVKKKKKIDTNVKLNKSSAVIEIVDDDDEKYYAATQELFDDLCSQRALSPEVQVVNVNENQSIKKQTITRPYRSDSPESIDAEEKINEFVSNLTCSQIQDVVGVQKEVTVLKKMPSDGSDVVATPKKIDCLSVLELDLPNTQEIKTGITLFANSDTESLKDDLSESDITSEKSTPVKLKHKQKITNRIRINLSDKFDPDTIPVRSSSRVRKPTSKIQNCDETFKDTAEKILKPSSNKAQKNNLDGRSSNEKNDSHKKEKSSKSEIKNHDLFDKSSNNSSKNQHNVESNNSTRVETEKPKKNESKRGRKPKQKDEKIEQVKSNTKKFNLDENTEKIHSNNTDISTRSKQKGEEKRQNESNSSNKKCISPEKERSRPDSRNKSHRKRNKERSKSPEIKRKRTTTKEKSRSPELEIRKKPRKERSKSPEIEIKRRPATKRSRSSEKEKKRKPAKERSKSPERMEKRKTSKESEKSVLNCEETEVRRSKRNRAKKSEEPIKTISPTNEHSTVYSTISLSSDQDTSNDSPLKLKRPANTELEMPHAKKPRSVNNKSILRATPARKNKTQYVLFTALASEEMKNKLEKLGAVVVSDVLTCTVVLTLQIKRTFKLLCAVGLGKPIVGPNWVQACADTNMIVDPWLYLLKDEATEKRFKFNLQQTLVSKREFLKGYNVSSTPSVMPSAAEMKLIVECSGGRWREDEPNWVCVSTPADRALWVGLRRRGAVVVSSEFILAGVLRQRLDIEGNLL